jgi:hypothetical protein
MVNDLTGANLARELRAAVIQADYKRGDATLNDVAVWDELSNGILHFISECPLDTEDQWRAILALQSHCLTGLSFISNPSYNDSMRLRLQEHFIGLFLKVIELENSFIEHRFDESSEP